MTTHIVELLLLLTFLNFYESYIIRRTSELSYASDFLGKQSYIFNFNIPSGIPYIK